MSADLVKSINLKHAELVDVNENNTIGEFFSNTQNVPREVECRRRVMRVPGRMACSSQRRIWNSEVRPFNMPLLLWKWK